MVLWRPYYGLSNKTRDDGERGVKNCVMSFMDDPLAKMLIGSDGKLEYEKLTENMWTSQVSSLQGTIDTVPYLQNVWWELSPGPSKKGLWLSKLSKFVVFSRVSFKNFSMQGSISPTKWQKVQRHRIGDVLLTSIVILLHNLGCNYCIDVLQLWRAFASKTARQKELLKFSAAHIMLVRLTLGVT